MFIPCAAREKCVECADAMDTVFEGDKVRAEQQKRIEEDILENRAPIPDNASDKESALHVGNAKI